MKKNVHLISFILLFHWAGCSLSTPTKFNADGVVESDAGDMTGDIDAAADEIDIPPTCGNGVVDSGEECDDGNAVDGDGCDTDCTFSCSERGDCADGDLCNGQEECDTDAHMCAPGELRPDGFVCLETPRSICLGGACEQSICGDGFVDTGRGEFCDPPGGACLPDCTLGCTSGADCPDDGEVCNGNETCDETSNMCRVGSNLPPRSPCNDALACTRTDECNGLGRCIGTGNPCSDGIACTEDICNEPDGSCTLRVLPNHCLIGGVCIFDGTVNTANPCESCQSAVSSDSWSPLPDMTPCDLGICCGGQCRPMGTCCSDSDCPPACTGTEAACSGFLSDEVCFSQNGCEWLNIAEPYCTGTRACTDIVDLDLDGCLACGCSGLTYSGGRWRCINGPPYACGSFVDELSCSTCGCEWVGGGVCAGTHEPCNAYADPVTCDTQLDCAWGTGTCIDYQCE